MTPFPATLDWASSPSGPGSQCPLSHQGHFSLLAAGTLSPGMYFLAKGSDLRMEECKACRLQARGPPEGSRAGSRPHGGESDPPVTPPLASLLCEPEFSQSKVITPQGGGP